ncbi:hypothetical protein D3C86_1828930 [compost metagenome]
MFTDGAHQQFFEGADVFIDVHRPRIERLLTGEGEQAMGQRGGAHGRVQRRVGIELNLVGARVGDTFLDQFQASDDAGQQVVEVMGDAAGQLAQRVHFLHLQQLGFGTHTLGDFTFQLRGCIV